MTSVRARQVSWHLSVSILAIGPPPNMSLCAAYQELTVILTAMLYHEKYDMRWAPPFAANCLQAAG